MHQEQSTLRQYGLSGQNNSNSRMRYTTMEQAPAYVPVDSGPIVARSAAIMGLVGIALIHLLDAGGKFSETPYIFWMYVGLIVSSLGLAAVLVHRESSLVWLATAALPAMTMIGYALSRTTGLPAAMGDIGNWAEPLGLASLLIEGCLVALGVYRLMTFNNDGMKAVR